MITPLCASDHGTQQDDFEHDTVSFGVAESPIVLPGHLAELRCSGLIGWVTQPGLPVTPTDPGAEVQRS
jgi:hypothetical protein